MINTYIKLPNEEPKRNLEKKCRKHFILIQLDIYTHISMLHYLYINGICYLHETYRPRQRESNEERQGCIYAHAKRREKMAGQNDE